MAKKDNIHILNSLPNYTLAHFYCREGVDQGGSCILLNSALNYNIREDLCILGDDSVFERSCVEIINFNVVVISIYRVANILVDNVKLFLEKLETLLQLLSRIKNAKNIYISLDFNVDVMEDSSQPKQRFDFRTLVEPFGFKAHFVTLTRITDKQKSCIDNIISLKFKSSFSTLTMNLELGLSDHRTLFIDISNNMVKQNKNTDPKVKSRLLKKKIDIL